MRRSKRLANSRQDQQHSRAAQQLEALDNDTPSAAEATALSGGGVDQPSSSYNGQALLSERGRGESHSALVAVRYATGEDSSADTHAHSACAILSDSSPSDREGFSADGETNPPRPGRLSTSRRHVVAAISAPLDEDDDDDADADEGARSSRSASSSDYSYSSEDEEALYDRVMGVKRRRTEVRRRKRQQHPVGDSLVPGGLSRSDRPAQRRRGAKEHRLNVTTRLPRITRSRFARPPPSQLLHWILQRDKWKLKEFFASLPWRGPQGELSQLRATLLNLILEVSGFPANFVTVEDSFDKSVNIVVEEAIAALPLREITLTRSILDQARQPEPSKGTTISIPSVGYRSFWTLLASDMDPDLLCDEGAGLLVPLILPLVNQPLRPLRHAATVAGLGLCDGILSHIMENNAALRKFKVQLEEYDTTNAPDFVGEDNASAEPLVVPSVRMALTRKIESLNKLLEKLWLLMEDVGVSISRVRWRDICFKIRRETYEALFRWMGTLPQEFLRYPKRSRFLGCGLSDLDADIRRIAAKTLESFSSRQDTWDLLKGAAADGDSRLVSFTTVFLSRLVELPEDCDPEVRIAGVRILKRMALDDLLPEEVIEKIVECIWSCASLPEMERSKLPLTERASNIRYSEALADFINSNIFSTSVFRDSLLSLVDQPRTDSTSAAEDLSKSTNAAKKGSKPRKATGELGTHSDDRSGEEYRRQDALDLRAMMEFLVEFGEEFAFLIERFVSSFWFKAPCLTRVDVLLEFILVGETSLNASEPYSLTASPTQNFTPDSATPLPGQYRVPILLMCIAIISHLETIIAIQGDGGNASCAERALKFRNTSKALSFVERSLSTAVTAVLASTGALLRICKASPNDFNCACCLVYRAARNVRHRRDSVGGSYAECLQAVAQSLTLTSSPEACDHLAFALSFLEAEPAGPQDTESVCKEPSPPYNSVHQGVFESVLATTIKSLHEVTKGDSRPNALATDSVEPTEEILLPVNLAMRKLLPLLRSTNVTLLSLTDGASTLTWNRRRRPSTFSGRLEQLAGALVAALSEGHHPEPSNSAESRRQKTVFNLLAIQVLVVLFFHKWLAVEEQLEQLAGTAEGRGNRFVESVEKDASIRGVVAASRSREVEEPGTVPGGNEQEASMPLGGGRKRRRSIEEPVEQPETGEVPRRKRRASVNLERNGSTEADNSENRCPSGKEAEADSALESECQLLSASMKSFAQLQQDILSICCKMLEAADCEFTRTLSFVTVLELFRFHLMPLPERLRDGNLLADPQQKDNISRQNENIPPQSAIDSSLTRRPIDNAAVASVVRQWNQIRAQSLQLVNKQPKLVSLLEVHFKECLSSVDRLYQLMEEAEEDCDATVREYSAVERRALREPLAAATSFVEVLEEEWLTADQAAEPNRLLTILGRLPGSLFDTLCDRLVAGGDVIPPAAALAAATTSASPELHKIPNFQRRFIVWRASYVCRLAALQYDHINLADTAIGPRLLTMFWYKRIPELQQCAAQFIRSAVSLQFSRETDRIENGTLAASRSDAREFPVDQAAESKVRQFWTLVLRTVDTVSRDTYRRHRLKTIMTEAALAVSIVNELLELFPQEFSRFLRTTRHLWQQAKRQAERTTLPSAYPDSSTEAEKQHTTGYPTATAQAILDSLLSILFPGNAERKALQSNSIFQQTVESCAGEAAGSEFAAFLRRRLLRGGTTEPTTTKATTSAATTITTATVTPGVELSNNGHSSDQK